MQTKEFYEFMLKQPETYLIMTVGFGIIGLWGVISLFVFITPGKPKSWMGKKLYSSGEKYVGNRNLKILYISYSAISLISSFFGEMNEIYIFFFEAILTLNVAILSAISLVIVKLPAEEKRTLVPSDVQEE